MAIEIQTLARFDREFKRLAKKYRSLPDELVTLAQTITENPRLGTNLGAGLFKIRLGSESKGGGKSGGFRVITYYIEKHEEVEVVYLVTIYDKSEEENITKNDLLKIIGSGID